jgi:hypothetical protein
MEKLVNYPDLVRDNWVSTRIGIRARWRPAQIRDFVLVHLTDCLATALHSDGKIHAAEFAFGQWTHRACLMSPSPPDVLTDSHLHVVIPTPGPCVVSYAPDLLHDSQILVIDGWYVRFMTSQNRRDDGERLRRDWFSISFQSDIIRVHTSFPKSDRPFGSHIGLATLRLSLRPVSGSLYSFQLTGYITLPPSLVAMMTPRSLLAVER